jgi:anti-sigma factor RsiW
MVAPNNLSCKELVELVTDYLEGALPRVEHARFEQHIAGCRGCTTYLDQMRLTINALGTLTEDSLEPQAKEELLQLFRDWKRSQRPP